MKSPDKILIIVLIAAIVNLAGMASHAQGVTIKKDTVKVKQEETGSQETVKDQNQNKNNNKNQDQRGNATGQQSGNQNNAQGKAIKQVKGARPDMSKAKGARPIITRPSGSGVPKGAGKPGGIGRAGKR